MLKSFILCATIALLMSGTAWAQTVTGPGYYRMENTLNVGKFVIVNPNYTVNPTPRLSAYVISDEAKFYISGWRFSNGSWVKVFPQGAYVNAKTDTTVYWHVNLALPISDKVDALYFQSALSDGGADLVVYK